MAVKFRNMKRIGIFALLLFSLALAACHKEAPALQDYLEGEWKMESYYGTSASEGAVQAEVYVKFAGGEFELFQKIGGGHFSRRSGTYTRTGDSVSGIYSGGKAWSGDYSLAFSDNGNSLTMTQFTDGEEYSCLYLRTTIPASVRKDAEDFSAS